MTERKHSAERDCNTCQHHVQGCSLDDIPARCWDCSNYRRFNTSNRMPLPLWQPIEIKKETPMSGGMEDAARMEAEEAELSIMREAVAPNGRVFRRMIYGAKPIQREVQPVEPKGNMCESIYSVDPLKTQVGGTHYKGFKIQPLEFAIANKLDFFQKDILKYTMRRKGDKAKRLEDLDKASHYLEVYKQALRNGDME